MAEAGCRRGLIYLVLNRANARTRIFEEADYAAFELVHRGGRAGHAAVDLEAVSNSEAEGAA